LIVEKKWWARVSSDRGYGSWVPTGQTDKDEAIWYMRTYPVPNFVVEWLLL
jgi:hypothetical protein